MRKRASQNSRYFISRGPTTRSTYVFSTFRELVSPFNEISSNFLKLFFFAILFGAGCITQSQPIVVLPNGTVIAVEIAENDAQRIRGLSGRAGLPTGRGMLFVHEESAIQSYWMKDMAFSIDIIWIDGDEVVGLVEDAQPEEPLLTIYSSPVPVDKVLEVSSGFVDENGLKIGDILDIELPDE